MGHVLVDDISSKSGSGCSILTNWLALPLAKGSGHRFRLIVPDDSCAAFATAASFPGPFSSWSGGEGCTIPSDRTAPRADHRPLPRRS